MAPQLLSIHGVSQHTPRSQHMANVFNENILKGKWNELKGEVQKLWGRLTDDELERAKGDANTLSGMVQQKYGIKEEEFRAKMNDIITKYSPGEDPQVRKH
jgi:uncharacterized protein YjbJ (UPF0337 family)